MRQCLDEGMLQSYFDGELSTELMERATSHLASCATCAAAASELEQESSLLSTALAAEFEASVPTERLRQRIDSAVAGVQVATEHAPRAGVVAVLLSSFSNLFNFAPGHTLGYASLIVMLAFGVIFGWMKFHAPVPVSQNNNSVAVIGPVTPPITGGTDAGVKPILNNGGKEATTKYVAKNGKPNGTRPIASKSTAVKLIPGERSYLQTIAKLDSTIKSGNKAMRPTLQVEYEKNLAVVDRAIAATRSAVKSNPNDPDAADFMFEAYQSKVDLLNSIADARVYNRSQ
jgi:hypothetical protein